MSFKSSYIPHLLVGRPNQTHKTHRLRLHRPCSSHDTIWADQLLEPVVLVEPKRAPPVDSGVGSQEPAIAGRERHIKHADLADVSRGSGGEERARRARLERTEATEPAALIWRREGCFGGRFSVVGR